MPPDTTSSSSRKLAAILFADIVGYTALMQKGEGKAMSILNRFQEVTASQVKKHKGEIIKTYGDGSLILFDSTVDAVNCAHDMQVDFRGEVHVPLRIGIHVGEVVRKDNDVFGNGVNIASRVESMGVAGGVLLSKTALDRVKNQEAHEFQSLGSFEFKNVEEPIEVFALVNNGFPIPKSRELAGKFRKKSEKSILQKWWPLIAFLFIVIALYFIINPSNAVLKEEIVLNEKSIAVLPFTDLSPDKDQEYFSIGMMDEILNHLVKIEGLQVSSRTSSMQYANTTKPITEISKDLRVSNVLEGSVRKSGNKVRITVQLIDGQTDKHIWSETYDKLLIDIFSIQSDVAQSIAGILEAEIYPEVKNRIEAVPTSNLEAYDLWLQGRNSGSIFTDEAVEFYSKAIEIDSNFAPAYADIGYAWMTKGGFAGEMNREEIISNVSFYLDKALSLDPDYPLTHQILGTYYLWYHWDFEKAEKEFLQYQALNPSSINGNLIDYYNSIGKFDKAKEVAEKSFSNDPNVLDAWSRRGLSFSLKGEYDIANKYYQKGLELFPESWYMKSESARAFTFSGQFEKTIELVNTFDDPVPRDLGMLCIAYYHTAKPENTDSILNELKLKSSESSAGSSSFYIAMIYAQMNEIDKAFQWLEIAYKNREIEMYWLKVEPLFKPLHGDSRWADMLDKVGFPKILKD